MDPTVWIPHFLLREMNKQKGRRRDVRMTGQHGEKVRHSSSATDGDSVAAWVEPSEGVSVEYVCVGVGGDTWLP